MLARNIRIVDTAVRADGACERLALAVYVTAIQRRLRLQRRADRSRSAPGPASETGAGPWRDRGRRRVTEATLTSAGGAAMKADCAVRAKAIGAPPPALRK